jgi:hypothetical protein
MVLSGIIHAVSLPPISTHAPPQVEAYTLYVISRYAEYAHAKSYPDLVKCMLGQGAATLLALTMLGYLFGSAVSYLVIVGDSATPTLQVPLPPDHPPCCRACAPCVAVTLA